MKTLKISKFCGEIRLKDGTFLIVDGEFDLGVSVSVQTSEGIKALPDGAYSLDDGRIIQIVGGKIKEIVEPLSSEPTPNPLETPPWVADGAIGMVGPVISSGNSSPMKKEELIMESNFQDDAALDNTKTTATGNEPDKTPPADGTVETEKSVVMSLEEVSSIVQDLQAQLATVIDRLTKLEGTSNDATLATNEVKQETAAMKKELVEMFSKTSPAKPIHPLEIDDEEVEPDFSANRVKQVLSIKKIKK